MVLHMEVLVQEALEEVRGRQAFPDLSSALEQVLE